MQQSRAAGQLLAGAQKGRGGVERLDAVSADVDRVADVLRTTDRQEFAEERGCKRSMDADPLPR